MPTNRATILFARPPKRERARPQPKASPPKLPAVVKAKRSRLGDFDMEKAAEAVDRLFRKLAGRGEAIR
jgi:hypothetical protein